MQNAKIIHASCSLPSINTTFRFKGF